LNSLERFYATIEYKSVDRPAIWLGMPDIKTQKGLFEHYGVKDLHSLKLAVGDDFYSVDIPYQSETSNAIYAAFDWYMDGNVDSQNRTLTADGCFKDCETIKELDFFTWPEPEKHISIEECKNRIELVPDGKVALGMAWSCHFQDACASFGMETALMNMLAYPDVYEYVDTKIVEFYLRANGVFYEATKGKLHAVLIGNDLGSQMGLMLSPDLIRKFVIPGAKKLTEQAHDFGLKVIYHSCGSIDKVIPDLINAGVDGILPLERQAGVDIVQLQRDFPGFLFIGGFDKMCMKFGEAAMRAEFERLLPVMRSGGFIPSVDHQTPPDVNIATYECYMRLLHEYARRAIC